MSLLFVGYSRARVGLYVFMAEPEVCASYESLNMKDMSKTNSDIRDEVKQWLNRTYLGPLNFDDDGNPIRGVVTLLRIYTQQEFFILV